MCLSNLTFQTVTLGCLLVLTGCGHSVRPVLWPSEMHEYYRQQLENPSLYVPRGQDEKDQEKAIRIIIKGDLDDDTRKFIEQLHDHN